LSRVKLARGFEHDAKRQAATMQAAAVSIGSAPDLK
jgi:hypothetical protein